MITKVLARWQGVVQSVEDCTVHATLHDQDTGEIADAQIPTNLIHPGDLELCVPGGIFYLTVGQANSDPEPEVAIRFARILWTGRDIENYEWRKLEWRELLRGAHEN